MANHLNSSSPCLTALVFITYLLLMSPWLPTIQPAFACPSDGGAGCRKCIVDGMKYDCPSCVTMLRCMAKCLWSGTAKAKCQKRCDCNTDKDTYPRLSDCQKCMSKCRCSCIS